MTRRVRPRPVGRSRHTAIATSTRRRPPSIDQLLSTASGYPFCSVAKAVVRNTKRVAEYPRSECFGFRWEMLCFGSISWLRMRQGLSG